MRRTVFKGNNIYRGDSVGRVEKLIDKENHEWEHCEWSESEWVKRGDGMSWKSFSKKLRRERQEFWEKVRRGEIKYI